MFQARKKQYVARKYIEKGVENAMLFLPQSAAKPPPIGFPLRGIRAAQRPSFPRKQTLFQTAERS